jgi:hypothetical protein
MNEQFIYLVSDDKGALAIISGTLEAAQKFIIENGNENWTIDVEEMC